MNTLATIIMIAGNKTNKLSQNDDDDNFNNTTTTTATATASAYNNQ